MEPLVYAPVITGFVQAVKVAGVPKKYLPLLAAALGVAVGILSGGTDLYSAIQGLAAGLTAVGLYEGYKGVTS